MVSPLGVAVREKLLEHVEAHLAIIQRIAQIAALKDPGSWESS